MKIKWLFYDLKMKEKSNVETDVCDPLCSSVDLSMLKFE